MRIALELFVIGMVSSSGPCLVSCSPVIVPYIAATRTGWRQGFSAVVAFLFGRLLMYAALGALAGVAGRWLIVWLRQHADFVYLAGAIVVSFIGVLIVFNAGCSQKVCPRADTHLVGPGMKGPLLLGLTTGALPCLPLLGVLAYIAVESHSPWHAPLYGAAFGAGKFISPLIPLGIAAGVVPAKILRNRTVLVFFSRMCGLILLFIGANLIIQRIFR